MSANALVEMQIDSEVNERAIAVLGELGMTVADAVLILLTRTANEGVLPFAPPIIASTHDAWIRAKIQEALDDPRPGVPHDQVEAHFAKRRATARSKVEE